jgi:hypothetical protein
VVRRETCIEPPSHQGKCVRTQAPNHRFGSSAVVGPSWRRFGRRRGGGEDPWLCGPGFRRVCLYRGRETTLQVGTEGVNLGIWCSTDCSTFHRERGRGPPVARETRPSMTVRDGVRVVGVTPDCLATCSDDGRHHGRPRRAGTPRGGGHRVAARAVGERSMSVRFAPETDSCPTRSHHIQEEGVMSRRRPCASLRRMWVQGHRMRAIRLEPTVSPMVGPRPR